MNCDVCDPQALVDEVGSGACDGKMAPLPPGPPFATAAQFERLRVAVDSRNAEVKGTIERRHQHELGEWQKANDQVSAVIE